MAHPYDHAKSSVRKLYTVTFTKGEPCCRMDGELATEEWWLNKCGIDSEIEMLKDEYILCEDVLYIKENFSVYDIFSAVSRYYAPEPEYDRIANAGYGELSAHMRKTFIGDNGAFIMQNPDWLKEVIIKPYQEFYKLHPDFNLEEYDKIIDSLNAFYEQGLFKNN